MGQSTTEALEAVANRVVAAGALAVMAMAVVSWLDERRAAKALKADPGSWLFALPARYQVVGGLSVLALLAGVGRMLWLPLPVLISRRAEFVLSGVGLALSLVGVLLASWARLTLGRMWGSSTSFAVQLHVGHRLVQHGPYARVGHPLYLGYLLVLLSTMLVYRTWATVAFVAMGLATFHGRAEREEAALAKAFGEEWQDYASRTRFLIPFTR